MSDDDSGVPDNPFEGFELPEYAENQELTRTDSEEIKFTRTYTNGDVTIEVYWLPHKGQHYRAKLYDGAKTEKEHVKDATSDSVEGLTMCVEHLLRMLPAYRNPDKPASEMVDTQKM